MPQLPSAARSFAVVTAALSVPMLCVLASSTPASAQSGALKSGVRGRVVIAPELAAATSWPVDEEAQARLAEGARVRRPTGRGPLRQTTEPVPQLIVVLEGARSPAKPEPREIRVEGMRFVPSQILISRPGELRVTNKQREAVTLQRAGGGSLGTIEPGESASFSLEEGDHSLEIEELPFARARVKVLMPSRFLPVTAAGEIPPVAVEGGEYQLAFYQGTRALRVQSLPIPDDRYLAIDAAVSANGVVTVSIKDGDLQVAVPVAPPPREPTPAPPPAPAPVRVNPAPEPKPAGAKPTPAPAPAPDTQIPLEDRQE